MSQNEMGNTAYQQEQPSKHNKLKWTIMIYLAGDNNLSANSIAIMKELEDANHREDVRVLACFDSNTPRPKGARYLEINHHRCSVNNGMDWGLHNDIVPPEERGDHTVVAPDFCNLDQGSIQLPDEPVASEGLSRFLKFALEKHWADRYMLILFGHGIAVAGNTFLADNNPPNFLRLKDFAKVLARHFDKKPISGEKPKPKLDILACDNCVMNGIEAAYEVRDQVDFMIGSQGLMLAVGWPFRKIINAIERHPSAPPKRIAHRVLKACARGLLDYSLMDRSSEQSLCDITKFRKDTDDDLVAAVKNLATVLKKGLKYDECGHPCYRVVRDVVRLARLEAQSYWDETFVDLYDFCKLLIDRCNDFKKLLVPMFFTLDNELQNRFNNEALESHENSTEQNFTELEIDKRLIDINEVLLKIQPVELLNEIVCRCNDVLKKVKEFVPYSYYVGPELQYSNGVSIYFPWTLPEDPIIFEPVNGQPNNFLLKTAFDEYKDYDFAKCDASDWAAFLDRFFRATLRDVRRFDVKYRLAGKEDVKRRDFRFAPTEVIPEEPPPPVSLTKSSPDTGQEGDCTCPKIKNYPRRFYVSPSDCLRRCDLPRRDCPVSKEDRELCASYLGWNVRGLVAEVIGLPPSGHIPHQPVVTDDNDETESEDNMVES